MDIKLIDKNNSKNIIDLGDGIEIGNRNFTFIAGPCAVETETQIDESAAFLSNLGVKILRGGAFKPRTSPYSFQGLGFHGLELIKKAATKYGMKVVSEIMDPRDVMRAKDYVDIYQIGSRNMQNYSLLKEIGKTSKPVLLKRGMTSTVEEWLMAAEYIALEGNPNIILCERGIRTFENYTRNTLDLTVIPIIKSLTNLPIIVDPSHGTGRRDLVSPMTRASVAVGADGIMIEVHPNPQEALSDGFQSLSFEEMESLLKDIEKLKKFLSNL